MQKFGKELTEWKKRGIIKYSEDAKGGVVMRTEKNSTQKAREDELDRFWDIDALLPKKTVVPHAADTSAVEIEIPAVTEEGERAYTLPARPKSEGGARSAAHEPSLHKSAESRMPAEEYVPENALLRSVRIHPWSSSYRYYEDFLRDAVRLYPIRGEECPRASFFSYVPQYSQMSRAQLEWYLWWRDCFRRGINLEIDYSYLLLYAYELINLSRKLDPTLVQKELCKLWENYRDTYHQLDSYLPEWICDCSLLHRLPPPEWSSPALQAAAMNHCRFREFYVNCSGEEGYARALIAFCCNYNYRKSKFCTEENLALFDRAILSVVKQLTEMTAAGGKILSKAGFEESRMQRDAYSGALCVARVKRRIEIEYCSFSRSHELRYFLTDLVKYTENGIRAALGIRSRLTVYSLPMQVRAFVDSVLSGILPKRPTEEPREAYEELYDIPKRTLSFEAAAEIEKASWETTDLLIEAFSEEDEADGEESVGALPVKEEADSAPQIATPVPEMQDTQDVWARYRPYLRAIAAREDWWQKEEVRRLGKPTDVIVDEINALSVDRFGDILLEEADSGYAVIEDYTDWLDELLREQT